MRVQHSAGIAYYSAAHTCAVCGLNSDLCTTLPYWVMTPAVLAKQVLPPAAQWEVARIVTALLKRGGGLAQSGAK